MNVKEIEIDNPPPIIIKAYDSDTIGNEFLGSCVIDFKEWYQKGNLLIDTEELPKPRWVDL